MTPSVPAGSRTEVYWRGDDSFCPGVVQHGSEDGVTFALYDDSDEEKLHLAEGNFRLLEDGLLMTQTGADLLNVTVSRENVSTLAGASVTELDTNASNLTGMRETVKTKEFLSRALRWRWDSELANQSTWSWPCGCNSPLCRARPKNH
eukprot:gene14137-biopygen14566